MKDERLEKMKQEYEEIRIPAELRRRVEAGIQKGKEDGEEIIRMNKKSKLIKFVRNTAGAVVAAMLAITIMANSGASIANAMMKIPVLGTIAEIVTFREYKDSTNDMTADVKIPEVSVKNEDGSVNQETTDAVNKSIQEYTDEIIAQYKADVEASGGEGKQLVDLEYEVITDSDRLFSIRFDKLQIMASGAESVKNEDGSVNQETTDAVNKSIQEYTDEIIAQYKADVEASGGEGKQLVDLEYEVITDSDRLFSIRFDKLQIMASGAESVKIYHIDKQTGQMINLKGLFKEDVNFIDPISDNIKKQMKEQMEADESRMYFIDSDMPESDFQSITEDTTFYVNDSGKLVIVFDEYEVAPGSMGVVEFEIPTDVIQDIVQDGFVS